MYRILLLLCFIIVGCVEEYDAPPLDYQEKTACELLEGSYELTFRDIASYQCCFITMCKVGTDCPKMCI